MKLKIKPVYYQTKLRTSVPFPELGNNISPYQHQIQTYCAIARNQNYKTASQWCNNCELVERCDINKFQPSDTHNSLCIINSAITGGGKTLANYAYSVEHCLNTSSGTKVLGVYPTNELLHDQKRAITKLFKQVHGREPTIGIDGDLLIVDGEFLREEREAGERNIKLIEYILGRGKIVLTNPDILYLICHHLYANSKENTGRNITAFSILIRDFKTIIFDEFHLYNIKQQASTIWFVGLATQLFNKIENKIPHNFIFSSATPLNPKEGFGQQLHYLEKFGITALNIEQPGEKEGRPVMEEINLTLVPGNLRAWEGENKALELLPDIKKLLLDNNQHRCLYVMDSVGTARKLKQALSQMFGRENVGEAHGLVQPQEKKDALTKVHTTGTSGIEVGIDFTDEYFKDLLLFEGRTSSQFLQRLGRIGRNGRDSANNQVIAIVPTEVFNYFQEYPLLSREMERDTFTQQIKQAFHWFEPERFSNYLSIYSPIEAEYTCQIYLKGYEYGKNPHTGKIEETAERKITREQLSELIIRLYPGYNRENIGKNLKKLVGNGTITGILGFRNGGGILENNIYRMMNFDKQSKILQPLIDLEIPYFDSLKSQEENSFPFHSYSLTYLLRRTQCQFVNKQTFLNKLETYSNHPEFDKYCKQIYQGEPMIYAMVYDDLTEPRKWYFTHQSQFFYYQYDKEKQEIVKRKISKLPLGKVKRVTGLSIETTKIEDFTNLSLLNEVLKKRDAIIYINSGSAFNITQQKHLPPLFEVIEFKSGEVQHHKAKYHLSFDLNAFLMESINSPNHDHSIIIS